MSRKVTVTKEMIIEGAFALAREQGLFAVTARKLAAGIGCSTQPLFRVYENMNQLYMDLYKRVIAYFSEYYESHPKRLDTPFADLGMAYISFAKEESNLFRMLFLQENPLGMSMYDLVNGGERGFVMKEIRRIRHADSEKVSEIFMEIWIFIHGCACMALMNDFDMSEEEMMLLLQKAFASFSGQ